MHRLALGALLLMIAACGYGEVGPYRPPPDASMSEVNGDVLYARACAWCHGSRGEGTVNGPDLNGELDGVAYTHFMLSSGRMPLATPQTRAQRSEPLLSQDEIASLVAYVESFGGTGPPIPRSDPSAGSLSHGSELFSSNCAACHSATGAGGALTSGGVAPRLDNSDVTPTQIAEAMLLGPGCANHDPECGAGSGAMPRFTFTESEVNDIVAYVTYLQDSDNKGGWSILKIGPVAEGAVAWIVGFGSLLAAGRWIGTRIGEK